MRVCMREPVKMDNAEAGKECVLCTCASTVSMNANGQCTSQLAFFVFVPGFQHHVTAGLHRPFSSLEHNVVLFLSFFYYINNRQCCPCD